MRENQKWAKTGPTFPPETQALAQLKRKCGGSCSTQGPKVSIRQRIPRGIAQSWEETFLGGGKRRKKRTKEGKIETARQCWVPNTMDDGWLPVNHSISLVWLVSGRKAAKPRAL